MEMLLRSVTDRNGLSISLAYEAGYPTQMHTPAGDVISFVFSNGKLTELRDQHGRAIQYRYQNDHLTEVVQMDGGVSRYEYSKKGYLTKRIDPSGVSPIENQYDEKGRVVLQTLLNGDTYRMEYVDQKRQMLLEYSAYPGVRCYTHDEKMMITQIRYPDGSREEFAYDEFSNRIKEVDRLGRVTLKEYDETGHLIKENRPEGLTIEHRYNESGDREYVRDYLRLLIIVQVEFMEIRYRTRILIMVMY